MRRKGHPSFPSAMTCCFFSSLKTLLMPTEPIRAPVGVNVPGFTHGRFWVTPEVLGPSKRILLVAPPPSSIDLFGVLPRRRPPNKQRRIAADNQGFVIYSAYYSNV